MKSITKEEFKELVLQQASPEGSFKPFAKYCKDNDSIYFLVAPDNYYGNQIDDLITTFVSFKTGEIIGAQIKGVSDTLQNHPRG